MIQQLLHQELMILCKTLARSATPLRKPWASSISSPLLSQPSILLCKCHSSNACIALRSLLYISFVLFYFKPMSQMDNILLEFFPAMVLLRSLTTWSNWQKSVTFRFLWRLLSKFLFIDFFFNLFMRFHVFL